MASSSLHLLVFFLLFHLFSTSVLCDGGWGGIPFAPPMPSFIPPIPDVTGFIPSGDFDLKYDHYVQSCPNVQTIIQTKIDQWVAKDPTLAPSLIKLHYIDCVIKGCDGSILLNHPGSERSAPQAKSLRGFQVIDDIKAELEKQCPKTVSCADVLAAAARDATVKVGGPFWTMSFGRKDGLVSNAGEMAAVPMGYENVTYLIEFFQSKGLNLIDLVVLSGAHTIGRSSCGAIQDRIFNFKGTGAADPSIEPRYLDFLKRKCRWASEYVDLDATTPKTFDSGYYRNLQKGMGLLSTDQLLYTDSRTSPLVSSFANADWLFRQQFAVSMINLGDTDVLTGDDDGEIRVNCNYVNK